MSYRELFYGEQPSWTGHSQSIKHYYPTVSRPAGWQMTSLVLHVPLCCDNCVSKIRKALKYEEVEAVDVDMQKSKVIVTGHLNPERVLRKIRKVKKSATFWDSSYDYSTQSPYSHTADYDYTDPHAFDRSSTYSSPHDNDYSSGHRSPSLYDYSTRTSHYGYSQAAPNTYYNHRGNTRSSYDAYRYL